MAIDDGTIRPIKRVRRSWISRLLFALCLPGIVARCKSAARRALSRSKGNDTAAIGASRPAEDFREETTGVIEVNLLEARRELQKLCEHG